MQQTNGTWQAFAAADPDGSFQGKTCEGIEGLFVPKIARAGGECTFECGAKVLLKKRDSAVFLEGFVPPKGKALAIILLGSDKGVMVCEAHELERDVEQVSLEKIPQDVFVEAVKMGRAKVISFKDGKAEKKLITGKDGNMIYTAEDYQKEVEMSAALRSSWQVAEKKCKQLEEKLKEMRKKANSVDELTEENRSLKEENARLKGVIEGMQTAMLALRPAMATPGPKSEEFEGTDQHYSARKRGDRKRQSRSDEEDNKRHGRGHDRDDDQLLMDQVKELKKEVKKLKKNKRGSGSDSE